MPKIYVATSWKNEHQPSMVRALRGYGHEVYDFRNPPNKSGFGWEQLGGKPANTWTPADYMSKIYHPVATAGFNSDRDGLEWCDICVLLLPCGRSAHLEAGYALGQKKHVGILLSKYDFEPELMYRFTDQKGFLTYDVDRMYEWINAINVKP